MMMDCFSMMAGFGANWGFSGSGITMAVVAVLASGATYLVMKQSGAKQGEYSNG